MDFHEFIAATPVFSTFMTPGPPLPTMIFKTHVVSTCLVVHDNNSLQILNKLIKDVFYLFYYYW